MLVTRVLGTRKWKRTYHGDANPSGDVQHAETIAVSIRDEAKLRVIVEITPHKHHHVML